MGNRGGNSTEREQPKNGQQSHGYSVALPRIRDVQADCGLFPSHSRRLRGSETLPKKATVALRATLNSYPQDNGTADNGNTANRRTANSLTATNPRVGDSTSDNRETANGATANGETANSPAPPTTARKERRLCTAWELPDLIRPMPIRRVKLARRCNVLRHYPALAEYIFNSRYATAAQVQRRFPQFLSSDRTARWQMAGMVQLGLLAIASVRSTSPNFPHVYFATPRGVRLIRDTYAKLGVHWQACATEESRTRGQAMDTVLHELLVTEFELAVWQTVRNREDLELVFTERRYFRHDRQLKFKQQGRVHRVVPDAGFMVTWPRQGTLETSSQNKGFATNRDGLLHFVELDNGTMSPNRILEKYDMYTRWARSDSADQYLRDVYAQAGLPERRPNFRLLMVAHDKLHAGRDQRRLADLLDQAKNLPLDFRRKVWLTTAQQLREQQHSPTPLDAPIWLRANAAQPDSNSTHTIFHQPVMSL